MAQQHYPIVYGVDHDLVYLAKQGLYGNGHMVMLEKNNHQVADYMIGWLEKHTDD